MTKMDDHLSLDTRSGLPSDLTALLLRYPRDIWTGHDNLGEMATFWLARHNMFRELGASLDDATSRFRNNQISTDDFAGFFAPRLQFLLQQLEAHHHVEDSHYFPLFRAAEHSLDKGFDLLERDHGVIHHAIEESASAASDFLRALFPASHSGARAQRASPESITTTGRMDSGPALSASRNDAVLLRASDVYADVNARLLHILTRHLADEEDLIVPLILDRGEAKLGVGHG